MMDELSRALSIKDPEDRIARLEAIAANILARDKELLDRLADGPREGYDGISPDDPGEGAHDPGPRTS